MPPRALRPAERKPESPSQLSSSSSTAKIPTSFKPRGKITSVACTACQRRKRKCNGARPTCAACLASDKVDHCTYNYDGDQTRFSAIRSRNAGLELQVRRLQALLDDLRSADDVPETWRQRLNEGAEDIDSLQSQPSRARSDSSTTEKSPPEPQHAAASPSQEGPSAKLPVLDPLIDPSLVLGNVQGRGQAGLTSVPDGHRLARTFGAYPIRHSILESRLQMPVAHDQRRSLVQPAHVMQPFNFDEFPPDDGISTVESMSSFISAFREYAARLVAQNVSANDILGPDELDVQALFKKQDFRQARTVSTFVPRFVSNFDLLGLKEKVAFSIIINLLLRWQLFPTHKTYYNMPEWLRPTPAQCFLPHFSSIEYLAWPALRDMFILAPYQYINLLSAAFRFEWFAPLTDADIFIYDPVSDLATGISPKFYDTAMDLANWTLDDQVLDLWPALEGKARFLRISREWGQGGRTLIGDQEGMVDGV